jgi:transposase
MKRTPYGKDRSMRIFMNKKEKLKETIIECCINGTMTVKQASIRLGYSERYVKKLKARLKNNVSMLHGNCGRQPKHTLSVETKQDILRIRSLPEYSSANTLHFQELLEEHHSIKVSYYALYQLLKVNNIKSPRTHRKAKQHNRRKRRSQMGELLQVDATPHPFFEFAGDYEDYSLHGFIDDATGAVTGLYMCKNECMHGYLEVTIQTLEKFGIPEALYADGSSIFFSNNKDELTIEEELAGVEEANTQYGKMMDELGITLILAGSSQAKGRIERLWNTLHDRLITEFKINKITTMEQANEFLKKYISKYNKRFAVPAENPVSKFVPLPKWINLETLLTVKYTRQVDNAACFSYKCITFQIQNIQILPRVTVELLISKRIGMKVRYKDKLYSVIPILDKNNIAIDNTDSINNIVNEFIYFNCLKDERTA